MLLPEKGSCDDIHVVPCIGRHILLESLAVPHLGLTTEDINGRLVVLMQMCAGPSATWERQQMHADGLCTCALGRDSSKVGEARPHLWSLDNQ